MASGHVFLFVGGLVRSVGSVGLMRQTRSCFKHIAPDLKHTLGPHSLEVFRVPGFPNQVVALYDLLKHKNILLLLFRALHPQVFVLHISPIRK